MRKPKPITPRPLPKALEHDLWRVASEEVRITNFVSRRAARAILAALAHEKVLPSDWHARLNPPAGCSIEEACRVLCDFATRRKQFASMEFSGIVVSASPDDNPECLTVEWYAQDAARRTAAGRK